MIFDKLERYNRYTGPAVAIAPAMAYLASQDFIHTPPGRVELQGDALFALVQEYTSKPVDQGIWEAHRRYIDVQYIVSGREQIFYAPIECLQPGIYVPEKDFLPLSGSGSSLEITAGFFVVFYPEDAHMPGLALTLPEPVKKVVVKVKLA